MAVLMSIPKFERFFRVVASVDVDKEDLRRYSDFVNGVLYDFLVIGEATAKANGRDVVEFQDLPITKGLQKRIHEFDRVDEDIELEPILEHLAARPQLDLAYADETVARLPSLAGGISVALGRTFKLVDAKLENPSTEHWERAFQVLWLLL